MAEQTIIHSAGGYQVAHRKGLYVVQAETGRGQWEDTEYTFAHGPDEDRASLNLACQAATACCNWLDGQY